MSKSPARQPSVLPVPTQAPPRRRTAALPRIRHRCRASLLATLWLLALCSLGGPAAAGPDGWRSILALPGVARVNEQWRRYYPGCALPGDFYRFRFRPGRTDRLLVYFNGGGACWETNTCASTLNLLNGVPSTYIPSDNLASNDPAGFSGIFESAAADNPYADWSMLVLPYCTGDLHLGSRDRLYPGPAGLAALPIRHRGFDNFLAVRNWLAWHYRDGGPEQLVVAGSSAGAYGALFNYAHLRDLFPDSRTGLLADAGNGVVADTLINEAIRGSWAVMDNLPQQIPGLAGVIDLDVASLLPTAFSLLANHYPADRFAQTSRVFDLIQVLFLNISLHSAQPQRWADPAHYGPLIPLWSQQMQHAAEVQAGNPNYRYFITPGCGHSILPSTELFSAEVAGVSLSAWLDALGNAGQPGADWQNLSCAGSGCASAQTLAGTDLAACLEAVPQLLEELLPHLGPVLTPLLDPLLGVLAALQRRG